MSRRKRARRSSGQALVKVAAPPEPDRQSTLLDLIDHVLDKGVVVRGDLVLGVADVDLIYAKLSVLLSAFDKIAKRLDDTAPKSPRRARSARPHRKRGDRS